MEFLLVVGLQMNFKSFCAVFSIFFLFIFISFSTCHNCTCPQSGSKYSLKFVSKHNSPGSSPSSRVIHLQLHRLWHFPPQLTTFGQSHLLALQQRCCLWALLPPSLPTKQEPVLLTWLYGTLGYISIHCSHFMMRQMLFQSELYKHYDFFFLSQLFGVPGVNNGHGFCCCFCCLLLFLRISHNVRSLPVI